MRIIGLYGFTIASMGVLIYQAILTIPLGVAVALEFLGPLTVAVLTSRRPLDFLWIILATAGVVILLPIENVRDAPKWTGVLCALGAALSWGLYIIVGQKAGAMAASGAATSLGMTVAAFAVAPVGIATAGSSLLNFTFWPTAILVALMSSALPYYLEMKALQSMPAKTFGILMSMEPAVASISGLVILGEYLPLLESLAIVLIILASLGAVVTATPTKHS